LKGSALPFPSLPVYLGSEVAVLMTLVVRISTSLHQADPCLCMYAAVTPIMKEMCEDFADAF
jgi:hypothetical protein